jgi:MraZ protein
VRFIGNIDAKADNKGRLFLPAAFRKVLQTNLEQTLYLRRDVFVDCLVLYPESVWNAQVDMLTGGLNPFDRKRKAVLRQFVADAEALTLDGNGRILVPRRYLEAVGIEQDVRFIGVDNTIELWSRDKAEAMVTNGESSLGDDLESLFVTSRESQV